MTTSDGSQTLPNQGVRTPSSPSHFTWGESWYLSYILHTTNNEHPTNQLINGLKKGGSSENHEPSHQAKNSTLPESTIKHHVQSLPSSALTRSLVDGFFAHFHLFCPILEEDKIRSSLYHGSLSVVLLRCILFVASIHCEMKLLHDLGYSNRIEAEDDLFRKAKSAFNSDIERDNLTLLYCSYLLHYWSGRPTSFQDSMWWLAGTIRCAQSLGMHRSMGRTKVTEQCRLWRRIWWLLYVWFMSICL